MNDFRSLSLRLRVCGVRATAGDCLASTEACKLGTRLPVFRSSHRGRVSAVFRCFFSNSACRARFSSLLQKVAEFWHMSSKPPISKFCSRSAKLIPSLSRYRERKAGSSLRTAVCQSKSKLGVGVSGSAIFDAPRIARPSNVLYVSLVILPPARSLFCNFTN